jgi:hypothetical protein
LFNLKIKIMTLPGDLAAVQKPTPVRPMDPAWLYNFLSDSALDIKATKKIVLALGRYNKAVNKAGKSFRKDLKEISNAIRSGH